MKFRPCIDIHEGVVKQIVGSTLSDGGVAKDVKLIENFVSKISSKEYATIYKNDQLVGGHIIMLGNNCEKAAFDALQEYPNGLQVGGGITIENAQLYLTAGASHVIVTSYVFRDGNIDFVRLTNLVSLIGKERLVLDLSCRRKIDELNGSFFVVTNKWTKYTSYEVNEENLCILSNYCDEFLVHGVDVEGKRCGIEEDLVKLLGKYSPIPVTYAGGVRSIADMQLVQLLGNTKVDITIGSALDIFGGDLSYKDVVAYHNSIK